MMQVRIKLDEKITDFMDFGDETLTKIPKETSLSFDETNLNLQNLLEKVAEVFNLPKNAFESFGLVFDGFKHKNASSPEVFPIFLTEDSMKNVNDDSILLLTVSAKKYAQKYLSKLDNINMEEDGVCNEFLDDLLVLVTDP
uniref:Uncharacterized protein n=1 Tax=Panagrolaimus sp. JU765 TaxID=591449 RepID=A0AC34QTV9_9BILA